MGGLGVIGTQLDVTDVGAVDAWARKVGAADMLICCSGMDVPRPFLEISTSDWDRCLDVNIKGVANCNRSFLPGMVKRGKGVIVNFSSGSGRSTGSLKSCYSAS